MRYLVTTKDAGVSYSPSQEAAFNEVYGKLLPTNRSVPDINLFSDAGFANCLKTMRSTSGSICYYRSVPVFWRSSKQGVRAYSTAESEYIACSDTIILSEHNDFLDFFRPVPSEMVYSKHGVSPDKSKAVLWVDNQSAIATAQDKDFKPRSRNYALRYLRVRDYAQQIVFCPTHLQKADALSKLECAVPQRQTLLHHVSDPVSDYKDDDCDSSGYPDDGLNEFNNASYSVCFGF